MVVYQFILGEINCAAFFVDGSSISNLQVKRQPHFEPILKSVIAMTQHVVVTNVTIRDVHQAWLNGQGWPGMYLAHSLLFSLYLISIYTLYCTITGSLSS
jgi:hypothetical protein